MEQGLGWTLSSICLGDPVGSWDTYPQQRSVPSFPSWQSSSCPPLLLQLLSLHTSPQICLCSRKPSQRTCSPIGQTQSPSSLRSSFRLAALKETEISASPHHNADRFHKGESPSQEAPTVPMYTVSPVDQSPQKLPKCVMGQLTWSGDKEKKLWSFCPGPDAP